MPETPALDLMKNYYHIDGITHEEIVLALNEKYRDEMDKDSSYEAISKLYTGEVSERLTERLQSRFAALKDTHPQADVDAFATRCERLLKNGQYYLSDADFSELFDNHLTDIDDDKFFNFYLSLVSNNREPLSGL